MSMTIVLVVAVLIGLAVSARWNWWRIPKKGIPILMYHKVGDVPAGSQLKSLWVSKQKFRAQLTIIKKKGFTPITFQQLYDFWEGQGPLPDKPLLITFDDGYQNNFTEAFPILQEFGFPATIFTVVKTVGQTNVWHDPNFETRIPMITWAQLKTLQRAGWEIGSHTLNHPRLLSLPPEKVREELESSRRAIFEFLDRIPQTFAYPYGNGEDSASVREAAKTAGYRIAVGIHAGIWPLEKIKQNPYNLPRIFVRGDDSLLDFRLQLTRGRSRL